MPNFVHYVWSGNLTANTIKVNAKLSRASENVRLVLSKSNDLSNPIYSSVQKAESSKKFMVSFDMNNLDPNTTYYYAVESDGIIDKRSEVLGSFTTAKANAHSYSFIASTCNTNSAHPVWQKMIEKNPLFVMVHGDLHYADPNSTDVNVHRRPYYERVLSFEPTNTLFRNTPIVYIWDDHDFSGNDSHSGSTGVASALTAYKEIVPHYPFGTSGNNSKAGIYQSFVIGNIRFILSDVRAEFTTSSVMSAEQMQWLKQQFLAAKNNHQLICWVSPTPITATTVDSWGGLSKYRVDRNEVFEFLNENNIANLFILSGDAHTSGIDDGENTDCLHALDSNNCKRNECSLSYRYPLFQASAITNSTSIKDVVTNILPMTEIDYHGQYFKIDVIDNNQGTVEIVATVYRVHPDTGQETIIGTYNFTRNLLVDESNTEQVVFAKSTWKYLDDGSNQGTAWRESAFNDTSWKQGKAPFGYNLLGINTTLSFGSNSAAKHITSYFRQNFELTDVATITQASLSFMLDDGAVIYINGQEVARANFNHTTYNHLSLATGVVEGTPQNVTVCVPDVNVFREGANTIAVELHQHSASSGDLFFDASMRIKRELVVSESTEKVISIGDSILIFPNPANDILSIQFPHQHSKAVISLFNADGKKMLSKTIHAGNNELNQVDISSLPLGSYIGILQIDNNKHSFKILKK